jgi:hypothetical protein
MDDETARRMHRLLARGKLGRAETDAIRESVLDAIERKEKRAGRVIRVASWSAAALATAAAVLIAINLKRDPGGDVGKPETTDLASATLEVRCSHGTLTACPSSAELVFSLSTNRARAFLSAYAEPIGHDGEPIFYFSKEDDGGQLTLPAPGERSLVRSVPLARTHRPGRYRVQAFLADRPLGREEMQKGPGDAGMLAVRRVEILIVE